MDSQIASTFFKLSPKEVWADQWEVLDDPGNFQFGDLVTILIGLLLFLLPGLYFIFEVLTRPRRRGFLCLTNWRLLYYERGEGMISNYHRTYSVDLPDIIAIHSAYSEGLFGTKSLLITLHTKFEDGFSISIGQSRGLLAKLPGAGKLFRRNSIGRDALSLPPKLYRVIHDSRGEVSATTSF